MLYVHYHGNHFLSPGSESGCHGNGSQVFAVHELNNYFIALLIQKQELGFGPRSKNWGLGSVICNSTRGSIAVLEAARVLEEVSQ